MKTSTRWIAGLGVAALSGVGSVTGCAQNAQLAVAPEQATKGHIQSEPVKTDTHDAAGHSGAGHGAADQKGGANSGHGGAGHDAEGGHTHTTKMQVTSQPAKIEAGKAAKWTFKIVDDIDNAAISDFEVVHEKLMHLIVVSKDMSWFNHLHPQHKGNGLFELQATLPRAGEYKIYADYKPKEREGEVAQYAFTVSGANPLSSSPKLAVDARRGAWMTKSVRSAPEGEPDKTGGAAYQIALMPMPAKIEAGKDVMLHFQARDAAGKPIQLEQYLGALGHLVLVSADSNTYLHTHPLDGAHNMGSMNHSVTANSSDKTAASGVAKSRTTGRGSDVMFHTKFPKAGLYKAWGQFQHGGRIITAPFVLNVGAAGRGKAAAKPAANTSSAKTSGDVQRATVIVDGGYSPASLNVQAGKPVQLTFVRREKFGCGDVVQIPSLKLKTKALKSGEKASLTFTPKTTGSLRFTCGMNMYEGTVMVQK